MRAAFLIRSFVCAVAGGALLGCASAPHREPTPLDRPGVPQTVAIVIEPAFAHGETSSPNQPGAAGGALAGGLAGGALALQVAPLIIFAPALGAAIIAGGALVGAAGGAALGAGTAALTDQVTTILASTESTAARTALAARTGRAIEAEVAAVTAVRSEFLGDAAVSKSYAGGQPGPLGYAAVIALRSPALGFWPRLGTETRFAMALTTEGRLVDPSSGRTTALRSFLVESAPHTAAEWTRDDAALAKREIEWVVRVLAERVVETFLLRSGVAVGEQAQTCGVAPVEPTYEPPFRDWKAPRVDSLVPRLAWEARPSVPASLAPPIGASDFRYDLRVWRVVDGRVDALVVERFGLQDPEYRFEAPLASAANYGWSVRTRYMVEGRARASRWSGIELPYIPQSHAQGVLAYGAQQGDRIVAQVCRSGHLTPCGCLDFLPAANLWQFVTP